MPRKLCNRDHAIEAAISDLNDGKIKSVRAAAVAYRIPQTTLMARMKGRATRQVAHQIQQRLLPEQEQILAEWILNIDK